MRSSSRSISRQSKVLIVDPDESGRRELARVLADGGSAGEMEIATVGGAAEALRVFRREHPDLILISTAEIDAIGREIAAKVRSGEGHRHTGIIFIDRRPKDDGALSVECLEIGADDFLRHGCTQAELLARVRAVLRLKTMTDELRSANHKLHVLSMTDELTGLANMRSFNQRFGDLLRRCRRGRLSVGVMMIDLDRFKLVNDTTNHLVGSFVIAEVGRLIRQSGLLASNDVAARYGGDEFILAVAAESLAALTAKGEAVRALVSGHAFERDGCLVRITASIGVAWVPVSFRGPAEDLIKAADLMLYRSKNAGRNRVTGLLLKYPVDLGPKGALADAEEQEEAGVALYKA